MTLATVDQDGRPHCRVLLLKGLDAQGFTFFTNYQSAKGEQLAARPFAAMTFFWPTLERQVRIEGRVVKVTPEESDAYYQVRPLGSRLGAWASPQSRVIRDREELQALLKATEERFSDTQPDCPEHWEGTVYRPSASSSGKAAPAACMIVSTTVCKTANGPASVWRPERHLSSSHLNQHRCAEVSVQEAPGAFGCALH